MSSQNNPEDLSPIEEIKKEYLEKIDYFGNRRGDTVIPGPFADLKPGVQKFVIWRE